ncbi:hypothetical protein D3C85_1507850 [compost metagenome]
MAGVEFGHHLLGTHQVAGIGLPPVHPGGGQAHGFQAGREKAVAAEQHQQHRRGDDHAPFDHRHLRRRRVGAPLRGGGEYAKTEQRQQQGPVTMAKHDQAKRLRCSAQTASASRAKA